MKWREERGRAFYSARQSDLLVFGKLFAMLDKIRSFCIIDVMVYQDVTDELKRLASEKFASDDKYRARHERVVNTKLPLYGVMTPPLRALAKRIKCEYPEFIDDFFSRETYSFEEVLLCGWQLGKDYDENVRILKMIIPRIDSWAHPDQIIGKFGWARDRDRLLSEFEYLRSGGEIEVRAYVMLMFTNFLDEKGLATVRRELPAIPLGAYYIDMAVAWLLCEIVVKFYDIGIELLSEPYLTPWVVNKAISKCRDSYRLTAEQKEFLKTLKK